MTEWRRDRMGCANMHRDAARPWGGAFRRAMPPLALGGLLAAALGIAPWSGSRTAVAQAETVVRVGAASVGEGLTTAVPVEVVNVAGLYGFDVRLAFDPTVVEVVDVDPSTDGIQVAAGDFLDTGLLIRNVADNAAGTVWYASTQLNPSEAKDGNGTLIVVTFRGRKVGATSPITITYATLASRSGEKLPATSTSGTIRVVGKAQAPPTPSPAPLVRPTLILGAATPGGELPPASAPTSPPSGDQPLATTVIKDAAASSDPAAIATAADTSSGGWDDTTGSGRSPSEPAPVASQTGTVAPGAGVATYTLPASGAGEAGSAVTSEPASSAGSQGADAGGSTRSDRMWLVLLAVAAMLAAIALVAWSRRS